jgi:predicted transcriptional regulator
MHILANKYEEPTDEKLIKLLTEKSTIKILSLLQDEPKLISEIVQKCDFSINLLCRKIDALDGFHLLYVSGELDKNGKREFYYQSKIKSFYLKFADGETRLKIVYNSAIPQKINNENSHLTNQRSSTSKIKQVVNP